MHEFFCHLSLSSIDLGRSSIWYPRLLAGLLYAIKGSCQVFYMVSKALGRSSIWYPRLLADLLYGIQDSWQIFYMVSKALGRLFIWYPKHRSALSRQVSLYSPANTSVSICSSPQENTTYEFMLVWRQIKILIPRRELIFRACEDRAAWYLIPRRISPI